MHVTVVIWLYTLAQLGGALIASFYVLTIFGRGMHYGGGWGTGGRVTRGRVLRGERGKSDDLLIYGKSLHYESSW